MFFASSLASIMMGLFLSKSTRPTRQEREYTRRRAPSSLNLKVQFSLRTTYLRSQDKGSHGCSPVSAAGEPVCTAARGRQAGAGGFPAFSRLSPLSYIIVEHVFASFS